jgi:hypothetical protein
MLRSVVRLHAGPLLLLEHGRRAIAPKQGGWTTGYALLFRAYEEAVKGR